MVPRESAELLSLSQQSRQTGAIRPLHMDSILLGFGSALTVYFGVALPVFLFRWAFSVLGSSAGGRD